jgi:biotin carboxyl carrier protein
MADIVEIDGKKIRVEIGQHEKEFKIVLDGKESRAMVLDQQGTKMILMVDDQAFDIRFDRDNKIIVDDQEYTVEIYDEQVAKMMKTGAGQAQKSELVIKAAMPGLIIEVNVKQGDKVTEGQALLIIEAMKMQNEMVSTRAGTIKKINIEKGQTVNSGDKLIIIE